MLSAKNIISWVFFLSILSLSIHSESGKDIQSNADLKKDMSSLLLVFLNNTKLYTRYPATMSDYIGEDIIKEIREKPLQMKCSNDQEITLDTNLDKSYQKIAGFFSNYGKNHAYNIETITEMNKFISMFNHLLFANSNLEQRYPQMEFKGPKKQQETSQGFFNALNAPGKLNRGFIDMGHF
jgi:hypothetical protein